MTVGDLWRGDPYPKKLHILDNDFFGGPDWRRHVRDIIDGAFKVCLNQGINIRLVDEEGAEALASIEYRDDQFQRRRLYTAWDNLGDERRFTEGVGMLERHGIPPAHLMVYMLIGYDPREDWSRLLYRFNKMVEMGVLPYPMVFTNRTYDGDSRTLKDFQRWVITGLYRAVTWDAYVPNARRKERLPELLETTNGNG